MGSLHLRGGCKNWYYYYTLPSGARSVKSMRTDDIDLAKERAFDFEDKMAAAKRRVLDEQTARNFVNQALKASQSAQMQDMTLKDYFDEWLQNKKPEISEASLRFYKGGLDRFVKFVGQSATAPLFKLTSLEVVKFRNDMVRRGRSSKTVNHHLKLVRMVLEQAKRDGFLFENPAESVKGVRNASNVRKAFSDGQVKDLLMAAQKAPYGAKGWRGMVLLGLYCGMRLRDASDLSWDCVDLEAGVLTYFPKKTAALNRPPIIIPMAKPLVAFFNRWRSRGAGEFVFPELQGKQSGGNSGLSKQFALIMESAGIDRAESRGAGCHRFFALSFHSLRHTCVSLMANAGVPEEIRRKLVGHTSDVHQVYTHLELTTLKQAVAKMG